MNIKIANVLSVIMHPLLMPTYLFMVIFYFSPTAIPNLTAYNDTSLFTVANINFNFKFGLLFFIFLYTFIAPSVLIYYLYKIKIINDLKMETLQSRKLPYVFTFLIYIGISYFFSKKMPALHGISIALVAISLSIGLVAIISWFWKISAHAVGIAGAIGAIGAIMVKADQIELFYPFLLLLCLAGFVVSARLKLNAHTPNQVLAGFILGLLVSITMVFLYF